LANVALFLRGEASGLKKLSIVKRDDFEKPQPLLLDKKEAAAYLGVSGSYLDKARSEGAPGNRTPAPPFVRVDGRVYYRRSDLDAWVAELESRRVV